MNRYYEFIAQTERELWTLTEDEIVDLLVDNFWELKSREKDARLIAQAYLKEY